MFFLKRKWRIRKVDKRTSVHRLIDRIDSGKISFENVKKQIDKIEQEFGALDLLYDVENRNDQLYYEELLSEARLGIYNRESLLKMAEIRLSEQPGKRPIPTKTLVIGSALLLIVIVGIVIAVYRR